MILVGMTYDLRDDYLALGYSQEETAEFDPPQTIDAIEQSLIRNGYVVERIGNIQALVCSLAEGKRWDIVFNICEGVAGIAREAQVPAILEAYRIPFVFSNAQTMVTTMDKALAKRLVGEHLIPTAAFTVIENLNQVESVNLNFPLFAKPLAEGTGKGISKTSYIENTEELTQKCREILEKFQQPVLVEEYLPGRDLTVGIVGTGSSTRAIGVMESFYKKEDQKKEGQSFYNKEHWKEVLSYEIATDEAARQAADIAIKSWNILGCRDGGRVDLRCDKNNVPCFLEVNPLAGLRPEYSDLPMLAEKSGVSYDSLIGQIMTEACKRYNFDVNNEKNIKKNQKRVVILYSGEDSSDREDEQDTLVQLREIEHELKQLNYEVFSVSFKGSHGAIESAIRRCQPDMVFNLVESVDQSDRLQYSATALLDRMQIFYTGARTAALAILSSKLQMKAMLKQCNIFTPDYYKEENAFQGKQKSENKTWIIKSDSEHASVGIDSDSVVDNLIDAFSVIEKKKQLHDGRWFAEQYIDGREFNLAMSGQFNNEPLFLPPAEIIFKNYSSSMNKIVDYKAKWNEKSFEYQSTQRQYEFNKQDEVLLDKMKAMCLKCWNLFGLSAAVRIDFRVDQKGCPWVIDINPNPCLSSDAGFMAAAARAGMTLQDIIQQLLQKESTYVSY